MTINPQDVAALVERLRATYAVRCEDEPMDVAEDCRIAASALEALMRECEKMTAFADKAQTHALNMGEKALAKQAERDALAEKVQRMEEWRRDVVEPKYARLEAENRSADEECRWLAEKIQKMEPVVEAALAWRNSEAKATEDAPAYVDAVCGLIRSLSTLDGDK